MNLQQRFNNMRSYLRTVAVRTTAVLWEIAVMSYLAIYYISESIILTLTPTFLRPRKSLRGQVVVITGGGGGVGSQLALQLARAKAKVVIWDNNEEAMEKTQELLHKEGYEVHTYLVDLADRHNVYKNADLVKSEVGSVDILINNAAVVCGKTLLDLPDHWIEKTYQVNIMSHYWTAKAFLGDMIKNGRGHIVTVASVAGLMGTYKCTDYSATKFAAVGFHESLFTELRTHGHEKIHATLVCPYYINTGMFAGVKPRLLPMLEPSYVAKRIVKAIRYNEVLCVMPEAVRVLSPLKYLLPAKLCWALMYKVMQGPQSMMKFKGQQGVAAA